MRHTITLDGRTVEYELEIKKVRNINLRVRPDGLVMVSANRWQSLRTIERLLQENAASICRAIDRAQKKVAEAPDISVFSDRKAEHIACLAKLKPYYDFYVKQFYSYCGPQPELRLRRMKSCWGNCRPKEKILTFNSFLAYVPEECVEYVVVHEFSHFLYANHSREFYATVEHFLPDWKERRKCLRTYEVYLREE